MVAQIGSHTPKEYLFWEKWKFHFCLDDSENACLNGERAGQTQLTIPQQNAINDMEEVQKSVDTEHVPANPTHYEGPPM